MNTIEKYAKYVNTSMVAGIEPVVFEKASGAVVTGEDGRDYLDCFAGIAVTNVGHSNPEVINAAKAQLDRYVHCCSYVYYNRPMADLAEKLAQICPGRLQKSFFGSGGAEAIEGALRLAKTYTGKRELIALHASFHGRSYATLSVTGNAARKKRAGPYMPGVSFVPAPYCYRCSFGLSPDHCNLQCAEYVDETIRLSTYNDVAAFIAEPVLGEGGIITPPDGYFAAVKKILDRYGILLLLDEVQTGFGRTGKMFGAEHYGVEPHIMALAKGIANGFPLSAFIAQEEIANAFQPGEHLTTFGGNPVSCAAALAAIEFIETHDLCRHATEKGEKFRQRFTLLKKDLPIVGDVRGKGLMIGIELVKDSSKTPAAGEAKTVRQKCLQNGLLIGVGGIFGNVLRIQPPLVISEKQLNKAGDILEKSLREL
jgi:4-aminobutyrate aminotransferase